MPLIIIIGLYGIAYRYVPQFKDLLKLIGWTYFSLIALLLIAYPMSWPILIYH